MQLGKAMHVFDRILDGLALLSAGLLVFLVVAVSADVTLRYFFNSPFMWLAEISEYVLLYITFLGSAWLLKKDGHIVSDLLISRLPPSAYAASGIFSSLIGVIISLTFIWYGVDVTWDNFERAVYRPTALEFPKGPLLAVIPFGSFLLLIQFLRRMYEYVLKWGTSRSGVEHVAKLDMGF